jgi:hypothetical protein
VLPAEQPPRTPATAKSATAKAHLATGQCDGDLDVMPFQLQPDGNATR